MKKNVLLLAIAILLISSASFAQTKIGYIRVNDIVGLMPQVQKINIDTVGQKFVQDSVLPRYEYIQSEYNRKLVEFGDTTKPKSIRDQILKDLQGFKEELDNAQGVVEQVMQYKQQEFLQPFYIKANTAINDVAKAKGYTYVLSSESFVVAPEADNLTLPVLAKLGIEAPKKPAAPAAAPAKK